MFAYHLVPCPAAKQFLLPWLDESLTDGHCQTLLAKCRAIVEQGLPHHLLKDLSVLVRDEFQGCRQDLYQWALHKSEQEVIDWCRAVAEAPQRVAERFRIYDPSQVLVVGWVDLPPGEVGEELSSWLNEDNRFIADKDEPNLPILIGEPVTELLYNPNIELMSHFEWWADDGVRQELADRWWRTVLSQIEDRTRVPGWDLRQRNFGKTSFRLEGPVPLCVTRQTLHSLGQWRSREYVWRFGDIVSSSPVPDSIKGIVERAVAIADQSVESEWRAIQEDSGSLASDDN
jgi:hypothetical protein